MARLYISESSIATWLFCTIILKKEVKKLKFPFIKKVMDFHSNSLWANEPLGFLKKKVNL
jgi:hypothetical protein